jgi:hypothetical protein
LISSWLPVVVAERQVKVAAAVGVDLGLEQLQFFLGLQLRLLLARVVLQALRRLMTPPMALILYLTQLLRLAVAVELVLQH